MDKSNLGALRVAFLGPSAPVDLRPYRSIDLRPPARRGDVARAVADGAVAVALLDGVMLQAQPPSPQEVEEAARMIPLIGAASLGALRACECPSVIGVGEVWVAFRDGVLRDEDEVIGTWEAETGRVVALPLVVVREAAARAGLPASFVRAAAKLPIAERTVAGLARLVRAGDRRERWIEALRHEPNLKQRDAAVALDRLLGLGRPDI